MRKYLIVLMVTFLVISCKNDSSTSTKVSDGFSAYVSAFTSGVISSQSTIKIELTEEYTGAVEGQLVAENLFSFSPSIDGKAYWLNQRTIEFRPNGSLPSSQKYTCTFEIEGLLDVPGEFEELNFEFQILKQNLFVSFGGIRSIDISDQTAQELYGLVRTSDEIDNEILEKCLIATQNGKRLAIRWEHRFDKTHNYTVEGVKRGEAESFVMLDWDGTPFGFESTGKLENRIPPLGEFTVLQVTLEKSPGLHFSIQFSDPVNTKQDLSGLIYLASGKKLGLSINGNEIKATPKGKLGNRETIVIDKSVLNSRSVSLKEEYRTTLDYQPEKPSVALLGDGVIMPSDGEVSFPFKAINLKAVNLRIIRIYEHNVNQFFQVNQLNGTSELTRVGRLMYDDVIDLVSDEALNYSVWNNFKIDLNKLIETEPGAIYRVLISFERYQSLYPCGDEGTVVRPLTKREIDYDGGDSYHYFNSDWYEEDYDYEEIDNPCSDSYYTYYDRGVSANIFSSNLGMIAKSGADNAYTVAITDLRSTEPISGVLVEAYNYQNHKIGKAKTDNNGIAHLKLKAKPYLMVAKSANEIGYLRVDKGSVLSTSLYDVGGAKVKKGIKGFIYGERGVWRPGDSLFISFMLEDKLASIPENHPIIMELYDPLGKLYERKIKTLGVKGLYAFKFKTDREDITGKWRVKAIVGNSTFSKTLKIETVKPNRLKVNFDLPNIISSTTNIVSKLNAMWLYGSPGAALDVRVEMELSNMKTQFDGYRGFQFDDRSKRFSFNKPIVVEGVTNSDGDVNLNFPLKKPDNAPGMLKVKYNTKVFETGGDFTQDYLTTKYSPYKSYVGCKMAEGTNWRTALNSENQHSISIASVDEEGKPLNSEVKVELYKVSYNWWWEGDGGDELTRYINRRSAKLLKSENFTVSKGKGLYTLSFPEKGWGKYMLRVVDQKSGHSSSQLFYANYSGWYNNDAGENNAAAAVLSIEANKESYKVGEQIAVTVPSGGIGNIFVTVEKGDRILQEYWVEAQQGSTTFNIEATADMAPNVYVNAMLIQPHGQTDNSLPIRMYGLTSVEVTNENAHLSPQLKMADELKPEETFTVEVSEKKGKAMAYTLALVDEGLLSLTRYKTPNAYETFNKKEALRVNTWDLYKYVMSAQTGKMTPLLAVGGDAGLVYKEDSKANRFKPVITYLGPFYLDEGDNNTHQLKIPNYVGAVRVMVVAGHNGAYGSAEKEVQVKKPLMVISTLPRVLGPSEKVTIPISIITMDDKLKNVSVKVTTNDLLKPIGNSQQKVVFTSAGEKTISFDYETVRKLGVAKFKVEVSSENENAFEDVELDVRCPNPSITSVKDTLLSVNGQWNTSYKALGIKGTNSAFLQVSGIPNLDLERHLNYLISYPHGCIEQTTSSIFPQLFLGNLTALDYAQKQEIADNVIAGLNRYRKFQQPSGGFSYWPGSSDDVSDWGTNYAGHCMIEAKNKGYDIPAGLEVKWLSYQKTAASNWRRNNYNSGGDLIQAYRLYTLALAGKAEIGAMNRLKNDSKLSLKGAWRLAAAYALVGRNDVANQLSKRSWKIEKYSEMGHTYGSDIRDMAMILETMYYTKDYNNGAVILRDIADGLNAGWNSTQTRAYALLAISKFIGNSGDSFTLSFVAEVNGKRTKIATELPVYKIKVDKQHLLSGKLSIVNTSSQKLFVSLVQSGTPVEINTPAIEKDIAMDITYQDMSGKKINVSSLKQGTDFKAIVKVKHLGVRSVYDEVALSQIFPSGWQIVNTRVAEDKEGTNNYTYKNIKDDRVYTYFDLNKGKSKTFEVLLNATFVGKYYKPAVFCAPMYNEKIQALYPGEWVEVIK